MAGLFKSEDGALVIGGRTADGLIAEAGDTPLFVYDTALLDRQVAILREALPSAIELHYAIKANPFQPVVDHLAAQVDGLDIASAGELEIALASGTDPAEISFAGPGKRDRELAAAIGAGITLNIESVGELERAARIADTAGETLHAALRVNPPFDLKGSGMRMGGGAKAFGIDAVAVPAALDRLATLGADFRGFHVFAGSQNLDADALIEAQRQTFDLVADLAQHAPTPPPTVNIGGGLGVPYFPGDEPVDVTSIGAALGDLLDERAPILTDTRFIMELGRFLAAPCGVYLTRVVDRKVSDGQVFLVTDGGLHHQLAASGNFGTVIRRNYPIAAAKAFDSRGDEIVNVVGCLCTPLDRLGDKVSLPRLAEGDIVALFMAGAYGRSASPSAFLGHPPPPEILV
ncbi:MAG: pyridoxal-dependent decarboxylase, exosortase A system-associated [Pacificimonas sp.]